MNLQKKIIESAQRLAPHIIRTPLERSAYFSGQTKGNIFFKNEHCQRTGSFKVRGALNKMLMLSESVRTTGVICASAGNHGIGTALAGKLTNTSVTVYLPGSVDESRLAQIKAFGAKVELVNGGCGVAEQSAREASQSLNKIYISPYNDLEVIAGQGTIGVELLEDLNEIDYCFVAVGGGGLISGIGTLLKSKFPNMKLIGCLPENSCVMAESVKAGYVVPDKGRSTISDSTAGDIDPKAITFTLCQELIDDFVLVSEQEIINAMKQVAVHEKYIIEGAAGVAVAGMSKYQAQIENKNTVVVVCGRNINFERYIRAIGV